jgi:drug/metabolite transporter (DMT)-like permease
MEYAYVAALVVALTIAFAILFGRWLKHQPAKRRIGGWVCVVVGVAFLVIHALEAEQKLFVLAIGLSCLSCGLLALITPSTQRTSAGGFSRNGGSVP